MRRSLRKIFQYLIFLILLRASIYLYQTATQKVEVDNLKLDIDGLTNKESMPKGSLSNINYKSGKLGEKTKIEKDHRLIFNNKMIPLPPEDDKLHKWLIVNSKLFPNISCESVVNSHSDWNVLFLHGTKPPGISHKECIYFDSKSAETFRQKSFPLEETHNIIMLAYLHLVKIGADVIIPDFIKRNNAQIQRYSSILESSHYDILAAESNTVLSSFPMHFACPVNTSYYPYKYYISQRSNISLLAYVCSKSPNVDMGAPPIAIHSNNYASSLILSTAAYHKEAFWALPLFASEKTDISAWSIVVQKTLKLMNNTIMIMNHDKCDNDLFSLNNSKDIKKILKYNDAIDLDKCEKMNSLECASHVLAYHFINDKFSRNFVETLRQFFTMLTTLYAKPVYAHEKRLLDLRPIQYFPSIYTSVNHLDKPLSVNPNLEMIELTLKNTCPHLKLPTNGFNNISHPWMHFNDIILIVTFNNPLYDIIPFIEALYRPFFSKVIYCGPRELNYDKSPNLKSYRFTFINYLNNQTWHLNGTHNYECVGLVARMHFLTKGYLIVSDDVMMSLGLLRKLDTSYPWFVPKENNQICDINRLSKICWKPYWSIFKSRFISMFKFIKDQAHKSRFYNSVYHHLVNATGGEFRGVGTFSDIIYLPHHLAVKFSRLQDIFIKNEIFLEMAFPTMLTALADFTERIEIRGLYKIHDDRFKPYLHFTKVNYTNQYFLHPLKFGFISKDKKVKDLFCKKILPFLHDELGRIP